jgi:hypothetical protein
MENSNLMKIQKRMESPNRFELSIRLGLFIQFGLSMRFYCCLFTSLEQTVCFDYY